MKNVFIIAASTYRETIRDKILYGILIFALIFLASAIVIGSLSLGEDIFVIRTFGLAGIYLFGLIITIFLGSSVVYAEVEKKTTYFLLAKPVRRSDVILGKFLGLLTSIGATTLLMAFAYMLIVRYAGGNFDYASLVAIFLQFLEVGILLSILILFSMITTPLATTIYTIVLVYIGHLLNLFLAFAVKSGLFAKIILTGLYYVLPNLEKFNIRNIIVHNGSIGLTELVLSTGYAIIYASLALYAAVLIFNRKEL